jgi:hypothetical protein
MLAVTEVATIAIEEMLATRRMPCEAGVRLATEANRNLNEDADREPAVVMDLAPAPREGDAVLFEAPVFVEADAAPALAQKLLDADVSTERVQFTLRERDDPQRAPTDPICHEIGG